MATEAGRFTAWFSAAERRALESAAREQDSTVNFIVRTAVRRHLGREALIRAASEIDAEVTGVTGNNE